MFGRTLFFAFVALCAFCGIVNAVPVSVNGVVKQNGVSIGWVSSASGNCPLNYRLTTLSDLQDWCGSDWSCTSSQSSPATWGGICGTSQTASNLIPAASPCRCDTNALAISSHKQNAMSGGNGFAACSGYQLVNYKSIYIVSGAFDTAAMGITNYPKEYGTNGNDGSRLGEALCTFDPIPTGAPTEAPTGAPTGAPTPAPTEPAASDSKSSLPAGTVASAAVGTVLLVGTILAVYCYLSKPKLDSVPTVDLDTHKPVAASLELTGAKAVVPHASTNSV